MKTTKYVGVQERVGKTGVTTYYINYYELGQKINLKVGTSKTGMTAKKASLLRAEKEILAQKKKEVLKNTNQTKTEFEVGELTLDECFEKYYIAINSNLKSIKLRRANYYNKISPIVGHIKIKDINDGHKLEIYNYHIEHSDNTISSINSYIAIAQSVISILIDSNLYRNSNPFKFKRGKKPKQANTRREGVLTIEELNKLKEHMSTNYSDYKNYEQYKLWLDIAITTGGRVNTILNIKTEDLSFNGKKGMVLLRENKTLTNVKAYLNPDIVLQLKEFKYKNKGKNVKLFRTSYSVLYRFFTKVFDELFNYKLDKEDELYSYKKITPHSIRHTFATLLVAQNTNLIHIQKLMGHKKIETTAGYVTSNEKQQEVAVIELMNKMNDASVFDDFMNS